MTIPDMFPETAVPTVDQEVRVVLRVHPPQGRESDKTLLAALVREQLLEILSPDSLNDEPDEELATRLKLTRKVIYFEDIARGVRDHLHALLERLPADTRPKLVGLSFASDYYDNGYFFDDTPDLIIVEGDRRIQCEWEYVFGDPFNDLDDNLNRFSGDLTNLSSHGGVRNGTLVLDLVHLVEVEEIEELFDTPDEPMYRVEQVTIGQLQAGDVVLCLGQWVDIERVARDRKDNVILEHADGDESAWNESAMVWRLSRSAADKL